MTDPYYPRHGDDHVSVGASCALDEAAGRIAELEYLLKAWYLNTCGVGGAALKYDALVARTREALRLP